jgi:hypothetical protein
MEHQQPVAPLPTETRERVYTSIKRHTKLEKMDLAKADKMGEGKAIEVRNTIFLLFFVYFLFLLFKFSRCAVELRRVGFWRRKSQEIPRRRKGRRQGEGQAQRGFVFCLVSFAF